MMQIGRYGAYTWPYCGEYSKAYMNKEKHIKYQVRKMGENDYALCSCTTQEGWRPLEGVSHAHDPDTAANALREIMIAKVTPIYYEPWPYGGEGGIVQMIEEAYQECREDEHDESRKAGSMV